MSIRNLKPGRGASSTSPTVNVQNRQALRSAHSKKSIWAIGGGKGGIGKTLLASNMGVYLSWLNSKVVILDMDLGGANLHTSLGMDPPSHTISDLILGKIDTIQDLVQPTPIRNLYLISGAHDPLGFSHTQQIHRTRLARKLKELDADFILLDLGAGTAQNTLDFFLMADERLVIVTPEPTSIENGYRFIKSAFYRMLRSCTPYPQIRQVIEKVIDVKESKGITSPKDLLKEVKRLSPSEGQMLQKTMEDFRISLIINQVRTESESDIGNSIKMVCERYFGMGVDYTGYLPYDNSVWQSIRRRIPFIIDAPNSRVVTHLEQILRNLIRNYQLSK